MLPADKHPNGKRSTFLKLDMNAPSPPKAPPSEFEKELDTQMKQLRASIYAAFPPNSSATHAEPSVSSASNSGNQPQMTMFIMVPANPNCCIQ